MNPYLSDTKDASSRLVEAIFFEEDALARIQSELSSLLAELDHMGRTFKFLELNPDLDDDGLATAIYWEAYDLSPKADEMESKVAELQTRIRDRKISACALSGALLQIAKQGISLSYKGLDHCPDGRLIGKTPLKSVIWEARNQSLHFEEGSFKRKQIYTVFAQLEADFGSRFQIVPGKNLGYEVVSQLGWTTYAQYEKDMLTLLL